MVRENGNFQCVLLSVRAELSARFDYRKILLYKFMQIVNRGLRAPDVERSLSGNKTPKLKHVYSASRFSNTKEYSSCPHVCCHHDEENHSSGT